MVAGRVRTLLKPAQAVAAPVVGEVHANTWLPVPVRLLVPEVAAKTPRVRSRIVAVGRNAGERHVLAARGQGDIRAVEVQAPGAAGRRTEAPGTAQQVRVGQGRRARGRPATTGMPRVDTSRLPSARKAKASTSSSLVSPCPNPPPSRRNAGSRPCRSSARCPRPARRPHPAGSPRVIAEGQVNVAWTVVDEGIHVGARGTPNALASNTRA